MEYKNRTELGRKAYGRREWEDAYRQLSLRDEEEPLGAQDLEKMATSAYLTGRNEEALRALERAHHLYLEGKELTRASRCAFWLGLHLAFRGDAGPATGWFGRAGRLLQGQTRDCAERGYLLLPAAERQLGDGDPLTAYATAAQAAEIGERFAEADLSACALHVQGRALIHNGDVEKGLALLDEAMVAVAAGELSPIMTGLIYCSVIDTCQEVYAADRARQWTIALAEWCAEQPQLVAFTGTCLVHRAEIMQMHGAWQDALEEARRAGTPAHGVTSLAPAAAHYQEAEIHRLRGAFRKAEDSYRKASLQGCEPLPGLAHLWLAQGRFETAAAAISRALSTSKDRLHRVKLQMANVELALAVGDIESAADSCRELQETADHFGTPMLRATAAQSVGALELARGEAGMALSALRRAFAYWEQVDAPYFAARTRELMGLACRALADEESAQMELAAARAAFDRLGAAPDLARMKAAPPSWPASAAGLTRREIEVLQLVTTGKSNKVIAGEMGLSEKTIDRHISNIFDKLGVSSRTAATAWAFEHRLPRK